MKLYIILIICFFHIALIKASESEACPKDYCAHWGDCREDKEGQPYCKCWSFFDHPKGETCQEHVIEPAGLAGKLALVIVNSALQGIVCFVALLTLFRSYRRGKLGLDLGNMVASMLGFASFGFCVLYAINMGNVWALYPPWVQALIYIPFNVCYILGLTNFFFYLLYLIISFFKKQSLAEMKRTSELSFVLKHWILPCNLLVACVGISMAIDAWAMATGLVYATKSLGTMIYELASTIVYLLLLFWCIIRLRTMFRRSSDDVRALFEQKFGFLFPFYIIFLTIYIAGIIISDTSLATEATGWGYFAYRTAYNAYSCLFALGILIPLAIGTGTSGRRLRAIISFGMTGTASKSHSVRSTNTTVGTTPSRTRSREEL